MRYGRQLFFSVLCLATSITSSGQVTVASEQQNGFIFQHIDHTDGLANNEVFSLAQDKKGYVWIGTRDGLQRYDGIRFVDYPDSALADMSSFTTSDIYPDDEHGRLLYNLKSNSLKECGTLTHRLATLRPGNSIVAGQEQVYHDGKQRSWLFQVYFMGGNQREGIGILTEPGKAPAFVNFKKDTERGQWWLCVPYTYGILVLDEKTHTVLSSEEPGSNGLLQMMASRSTSVRSFTMDSQGCVWLITWSPLFYRYDMATGRLHTYSVGDILRQQGTHRKEFGWVTSILEDDHQRIWIGTAFAGLLAWQPEEDRFTYILHQQGNNLSLQYHHEIENIFQDREGTIWVATDKGISLFNPYRQYFTTLIHQKHYPAPLPESEINGVLQTAHGELLVGSWGNGINVYDRQLKFRNNISFRPDVPEKNLIWCFLDNPDGTTWTGCQHGYLHLLDADSRHATTIHPPELENSTVRCLERDIDGNMLLGLHNGKVVVMDKQGNFLPFCPQGKDSTLPLSPISNIFVDRDGRCWVASANGLYEFDRVRRCYKGLYKPNSWAPAACAGIARFNDSLLLVGIQHTGLFFFHLRKRTFTKLSYGTEQPMSVHAIRLDSAGHIWFTTSYDVCRYDPGEKKLLTYRPGNGLINSAFTGTRFTVLPSGQWLAWTDNELVLFSPEEINAAHAGPVKATITGFRVFDKHLFVDSFLQAGKPLRLSYKDNFISIEYAGMQFYGVSQPAYYYRLSGVDEDWVYAGGAGYANYTGLAPGKYRFEVKTAGAGSNSDVSSMDIVIIPPFWATLWFRSLCLVVLAALLYVLIRWRIRRIRHDADIRQQIATTEMMALRAQMNPHFIFNCINGIDALIQSDDKYHATIYLNKFARLIRNILDSSKQHSIPLGKDLETLQLYIELEQFRNDHKFTARITTDEGLVREDYKVPPLIVQPYVENAILHGLRNRADNDGRLHIGITRQHGHLRYIIEDNGVGRAASKSQHRRSSSYGMEMTGDRIRLFNRGDQAPVTVTDLEVDGRPAGTRVEVLLKIQ